jgi:hypothetical protein
VLLLGELLSLQDPLDRHVRHRIRPYQRPWLALRDAHVTAGPGAAGCGWLLELVRPMHVRDLHQCRHELVLAAQVQLVLLLQLLPKRQALLVKLLDQLLASIQRGLYLRPKVRLSIQFSRQSLDLLRFQERHVFCSMFELVQVGFLSTKQHAQNAV